MADFKPILTEPTSNTGSGVLAKLWRKILIDNGYLPALGVLMDRYLKVQDQEVGSIPGVKKKNKSTLIANVTASEMTMKTFVDLVFRFLRARSLTISIKVTFHNGKESVHSVSVAYQEMTKTSDIESDMKDLQKEVKKDGNKP